MTGMRSWMSATSAFASVVITAKVRTHSPVLGSFQFSQDARQTEAGAVLHADRIRLLGSRALDGLPLEEEVNRHQAAPPSIGVPDHRKRMDRLGFGVDGRRLGLLLRAVRDEAPG